MAVGGGHDTHICTTACTKARSYQSKLIRPGFDPFVSLGPAKSRMSFGPRGGKLYAVALTAHPLLSCHFSGRDRDSALLLLAIKEIRSNKKYGDAFQFPKPCLPLVKPETPEKQPLQSHSCGCGWVTSRTLTSLYELRVLGFGIERSFGSTRLRTTVSFDCHSVGGLDKELLTSGFPCYPQLFNRVGSFIQL